MRLGDDAKGRPIPIPREEMKPEGRPTSLPNLPPEFATTLDPMPSPTGERAKAAVVGAVATRHV
jgi:hypothetical protein